VTVDVTINEADERVQTARDIAAERLKSGGVGGVLAMRLDEDHIEPFLFTDAEELEGMDITGKYAIAAVAEKLLRLWPAERLAIIARGCDERHLLEMSKKGSIDLERIDIVGLACTVEEARDCECVRPYPQEVRIGRSIGKVDYRDHEKLNELMEMDIAERRKYWTKILNRCIKCYGCRNSCPLCNCEDCRLEESRWVRVGEIPPEYPSFHLIRAFHMADKCVGCAACERACPMGIPISKLHLLLREDLKRQYGYEAGNDAEERSPLLTVFDERRGSSR